MSTVTRELPGCCNLLGVAAAFPHRYPGLLESVSTGAVLARYDILFGFPQDMLRMDAIGRVSNAAGRDCGARFLEALDDVWRAEDATRPDATNEPDPRRSAAAGCCT